MKSFETTVFFSTLKPTFSNKTKKDWDKIVNPTGADKFLINVQLGNNPGKELIKGGMEGDVL